MKDDDLILLGIGAILLYLFTGRAQAAPASGPVTGYDATPACSRGGQDMCSARKVGGDIPITPDAPAPAQASYWQQTPGASTGVMRPADIDYTNPRLGSAVNDATLLMINRQIDQANAVQNWELSWQLAAKRDQWVKDQGY